jgi:hypothetical protein
MLRRDDQTREQVARLGAELEQRLVMNSQPPDSSALNSYFRALAETSKPVVSSSSLPSELRSACGPWVLVTAAAAKTSFALAGINAAGPVVDLALALSGVNDAQTELLKSIKADTLLLRKEPLQTAVTLMAEAKRVGPGDESWAQFLNKAIDSLYRAISLAASSEERAVVQFGLACAYLTLNKLSDAQYWIGESVKSERTVLAALLRNCRGMVSRGNIDVEEDEPGLTLKDMATTAGSLILRPQLIFTFGAIAYEASIKPQVMQQILQKRIESLRQFTQFANAVEICATAICSKTEAVILELKKSGTMYWLSEKTLTLPPRRSLNT